MAAKTTCISAYGQDNLQKFKLSIRTGKKGELSDLWLLVPDRRVFQKLLIYWDFHASIRNI